MEKLYFNITDIGENGLHLFYEKAPQFLEQLTSSLYVYEGIELSSNIYIDVYIEKIDKQINLSGYLKFNFKSPCSRCLEEQQREIKPELKLVMLPEIDNREDKSVNDIDLSIESYKGDRIDITDYISEVISVSLPNKILCNTDCKGLCPVCGKNLNYSKCTCTSEWIKPGLSALKNMNFNN